MTDDDVEDAEDAPEPTLSDEDVADIDPSIAATVAEADAEEADDGDNTDEETDSESEETTETTVTPSTDDGTSIGHVYCRTLGAGAAIGRDKHGDLDKDRSDAIDDYAALAKDLDIDDYVDEWAEQNLGSGDEMTPGQGMIVMSTVFVAMVLVDDDELLDSAVDQVGDLGIGEDAEGGTA